MAVTPSDNSVAVHLESAYPQMMTIELSKETQALIEKALASGHFQSADQVIEYAIRTTLTEQEAADDETYNDYLRGLLAASQKDKEAGRVYAVPHGELHNEIKRRRAQQQSDDQSGG